MACGQASRRDGCYLGAGVGAGLDVQRRQMPGRQDCTQVALIDATLWQGYALKLEVAAAGR
jgi:hypothetical protein